MVEWLPLIQQLYPACGITVFTYPQVTYGWWLRYVDLAERYLKEHDG